MNHIIRTRWLFQAAALWGCCLIAFSCSSTEIEPNVDPRPPNFTLNDLDGNAFQLSSTQGSVVMLHFFAPWCTICQQEAPLINELHRDFSRLGLVVVGIAVNAASVEQIEEFRDTYDVPYRILVDDGRVSSLGYGVTNIPTTYFIDRDVNLIGPYGARTKDEYVGIIEPLFQ